MNILASDRINTEEFTLDVMKVGVTQVVDRRLFADGVLAIEYMTDYLSHHFKVMLERSLLADKVLTDTQLVPFKTNVVVDVPVRERYWKWYFIPWRRTRTHSVRTTVWGHVNVNCEYFRTFPLADITYPKEFGKSFKWMQLKAEGWDEMPEHYRNG